MVKNLVSKIEKELSGERAKDYVAEIIQHHRIQASPGFRAAAKYVAGQLTEYGIKNETISFPGDGKTFIGHHSIRRNGQRTMQPWN